MFRSAALVGLLVLTSALPGCGLIGDSVSTAPLIARSAVTRAECGPGSDPETALQGQVPITDRVNGRALGGYRCNLEVIAQLPGDGASWQHDWYGDCAYHGTAGVSGLGVVAIDASTPSAPVATVHLTESAMIDPWESLKVNEQRGLLGAVRTGSPAFAVYDVARDCTHPQLLADVEFAGMSGHGGNFSPDGKTYYGASLSSTYAIDIDDPTQPELLINWTGANCIGATPHDLSLNAAGTRAYLTNLGGPLNPANSTAGTCITGPNGLVIVDTGEIKARKPDPQIRVIGQLFWTDGSWAQMTQPVTINGRPYVIFADELGSGGVGGEQAWARACALGTPPFGHAKIIDISDESNPVVVSRLLLEVNDPANCAVATHDNPARGSNDGTIRSVGYDSHYCTVDDPADATVLGCGHYESGIRVFDIRDPAQPKEIAYFIPPATRTALENEAGPVGSNHGGGTTDWCTSQVRFRKATDGGGELWTTCQDNGFYILKFTNGVWPFD